MTFARGLCAFVISTTVVIVACSEEGAAGPPNPSGKAEGLQCKDGKECQSLTCKSGKCTPVTGSNPTDSKRNGDETDVDCGGQSAPGCADGKACKVGTDCANGVCKSGKCAAPSPTDGAKNGDETDVDCGGSKAPKCAVDKACKTNDDCASGGCSYKDICVAAPSCVLHFGGDTCGPGETGTAEAQHESCCATAKLASGARLGKYHITAGRMRAFLAKYDGNLKQWAADTPAWQGGTDSLPGSMDEAHYMLGPGNKRGCSVGVAGKGGRTYWQDIDGEEKSDFDKDTLDEKALNCLPQRLAAALCVYDGGRLPRSDELFEAITNNDSTRYPWGDAPGFRTATQMDEIVHAFSYETPKPAIRKESNGFPLDRAFFVAPPGRRPGGNNKIGIADAVGNMLTWVEDGINEFAWTSSWEEHPVAGHPNKGGGSPAPRTQEWKGRPGEGDVSLGYYALGGRCAFDD